MKFQMLMRFVFAGVAGLSVVSVLVFFPNSQSALLASSQDEEDGDQSEGSDGGYRAQIRVRIIGPGDNVNFDFNFHGIKVVSSGHGSSLLTTRYGTMVVTGNSNCTYPLIPCTINVQNRYNGMMVNTTGPHPAFYLDLWEQEDDTVLYRFYIGMQPMEFQIRTKQTKTGPQCGPPVSYRTVTKRITSIDIGSNPGRDKIIVDGGRHVHYLLTIHDMNAKSIRKGDKCIEGHKIYDFTGGRDPHCPAKVHVAWNILLEEVEVEVEKCDRDWRPKKDGEPAFIKARIVKPEGAAGVFRFKLTDISNEPGYCMNAGDEEDADLAFIWEPDKFDPPEYVETGSEVDGGEDGTDSDEGEESERGVPDEVMETKEAVNSATVKIQPKDYGAYGKLMVEVNFCGVWCPAKVVGGDGYSIDIPLDDDGNHIADGQTAWDMDGAPANDDKDSYPEGDRTPGDGLTNYEEYRGFMVKKLNSGGKEWVATDPEVKNLFICFSDPSLSWGYFGVSELELNEIDEDGFNGIDSRVVNYNHKTAHEVDQHGIYMKVKSLTDAAGETSAYLSAGDRWTPKDVESVDIDVEGHESLHELYCTEAHELGHCVGINHHGDLNEDMTLSDLMNEPGFSHYRNALRNHDQSEKYDLAVCHGENSGFEMCFMRYHFAEFYKRDDGKIYVYPEWDAVTGVLCSTKEGEAINREGAPWEETIDGVPRVFPMSGKATKGNCMGQIRVNDKE